MVRPIARAAEQARHGADATVAEWLSAFISGHDHCHNGWPDRYSLVHNGGLPGVSLPADLRFYEVGLAVLIPRCARGGAFVVTTSAPSPPWVWLALVWRCCSCSLVRPIWP